MRELKHPRGLDLIFGVGARLPGTGALEGQVRLGQYPSEMSGADEHDSLLGEVRGQPRQRPTRQRHPLGVGTGTGDRDDPLAILTLDPAGTPAPVVRAQGLKPPLVELTDHLAYMVIVGQPARRDGRRSEPCVGAQQNRRALARGLVLCSLGEPLQSQRLLMRKRPHKHFRGTHRHLHRRDASQFAAGHEFPVKQSEKAH